MPRHLGLAVALALFLVADINGQAIRVFVDVGAQLDDVFNLHLAEWAKLVETVTIPDVTQKVNTPVGHIKLELKNMKLNSFSASAVTSVGSASGTAITLSGLAAELTLDWHWREDSFPHISDSGGATASFSGGKVTGLLSSTIETGSAEVAFSSVGCDLGDFKIDLHTKWSWLYDIIKGSITSDVKSAAQQSIVQQATQLVPQYANQYLKQIPQSVPLHVHLGNYTDSVTLNIALLTMVQGSPDVDVTAAGAVDHAGCPHAPVSVTAATPEAGTLATLAADVSVFNCISWELFQQGGMTKVFSEVPGDVLPLNTSQWGDYCPQLPTAFPNLGMLLNVTAASEPLLTVAPGAMNLTAILDMDFLVVFPNGSTTSAFVITANLTMSVDGLAATVTGQASINVTASVGAAECPLSLKSSAVGTFDLAALEQIYDFAAKVVASALGQKLSAGHLLVVPNFPPALKLVLAGVDTGPGFIRVYSSIAPTSGDDQINDNLNDDENDNWLAVVT